MIVAMSGRVDTVNHWRQPTMCWKSAVSWSCFSRGYSISGIESTGIPDLYGVGVELMVSESIDWLWSIVSINGSWERLMVTLPDESVEVVKVIPKK